MTETSITKPALYTNKIEQDYASTMRRLWPIQAKAGLKGHIVTFGESVSRTVTQVVELFKTGKWAVEDQVRVKIQREYKQVYKITTDFERDLAAKTSNVRGTKFDLEMRKDLDARLHAMGYIVHKALGNKPNDQKLADLEQVIENELTLNNDVISSHEEKLKIAANGPGLAIQVGAKLRQLHREKLEKSYTDQLEEKLAKRNPTNGNEIKERSITRQNFIEANDKLQAMIDRKVPVSGDYVQEVNADLIKKKEDYELTETTQRIMDNVEKKLARVIYPSVGKPVVAIKRPQGPARRAPENMDVLMQDRQKTLYNTVVEGAEKVAGKVTNYSVDKVNSLISAAQSAFTSLVQ